MKNRIKLIWMRIHCAYLMLKGRAYCVEMSSVRCNENARTKLVRQQVMLYAANANNFNFAFKSNGKYYEASLTENDDELWNLKNLEADE